MNPVVAGGVTVGGLGGLVVLLSQLHIRLMALPVLNLLT
jgi:hypothetical protein